MMRRRPSQGQLEAPGRPGEQCCACRVEEVEITGTSWDPYCWRAATLRGSGQAAGGPYKRKMK